MKRTLRSGQFWGGVAVGILLLAFFPGINPRVFFAKPKAA